MKNLFQALLSALEAGDNAVLVTVVASSGSTPRGAGARMLVTGKGRLCGTIGGGAVEYRAEQMAVDVLANKRSRTELFQLHPNQVADLGMICGGDVTVYFHYIPAGDEAAIAFCRHLKAVFLSGEASWLICDITPGGSGSLTLLGKESGLYGAPVPKEALEALASRPAQLEVDKRRFYCERLTRAGRVYIFGGGHVARELVPALARVDFTCVVLEDREAFMDAALFPGVSEVKLVDMNDLSEVMAAITADDYVCVMTRGHKDDYLVERQVLRTPAHYIGVIGSARKTAGVQQKLREDGYTDGDFARITTPIGLDILSETPAEIAVSIAAQLIMIRAAREKAPLSSSVL